MRSLLRLLILALLCINTAAAQSPSVTVSGNQLLVDGAPHAIKGICYHPVPKGAVARSFERLEGDLALMRAAGVNTLRVYAPIADVAVLDQIHATGMKVIIGFGYNQNGRYDIQSGTFLEYVERFKDHAAILMWELGNEYNYHPEWFEGDVRRWYRAMNTAAAEIHRRDPAHPVSTAHGELPDALALQSSPNIDVWGVNLYRWDHPAEVFQQWLQLSSKPLYLSEAGSDSYMTTAAHGYAQGVNPQAQADALDRILKEIFAHTDMTLGVTVFSFTDGWWKDGNPETHDAGGWAPNSSGVPYDGTANEEHWGVVDINRMPKAAYHVLKRAYTQSP